MPILGFPGPPGARAQEAEAPPPDPLDQVRELMALGDADLQVIDDWIAARIDGLKQSVGGDSVTAGAAFREAFAGQQLNAANSPEFSRQFAARAGVAFAREFGQAEPQPQAVVWPMARVLFELDSFETRQALSLGLAHPVQAVRYLCAKTYASLRSQISTDLNLARGTITVLRDVAVEEPNDIVLGALYEAMGYSEHAPEAAGAMAEVFAARVGKRQTGQIAVADRAELRAWEFLKQFRNRIPEPQGAPLVRQLAAHLTLDVNAYPTAQGQQRLTIEERIEVGEDLLEGVVGRGAGGNVRKAMKAGGAAVDLDMKLELIEWVGAEGQEGVLNKNPWNVPVGGLPPQP